MDSKIRLRFLGTRSLYSSPLNSHQEFGGNTNCVVLEEGDQVFIWNAGFGINSYGDELIQQYKSHKQPVTCHLLFSDFSWDNIMGFPFFTPMHFKSSQIYLHTTLLESESRQWLSGVCQKDFSPFNGLSGFPAQISVDSGRHSRTLGSWLMECLTAPSRISPYPTTIWVLTHKSGFRVAFSALGQTSMSEYEALSSALQGVDVLIQSAISTTITDHTMEGRMTFADAVSFAHLCQASQLYLTGFHPQLDDFSLQNAERALNQQAPTATQSKLAKESTIVDLSSYIRTKKAG